MSGTTGAITLRLQELLDAKGWTQKQLAETTGLRPARISQICKGFVDRLELDHIIKICDALQVTPEAWMVYTSDWMGLDEPDDTDIVALRRVRDEQA